jgi:hypothetical protein
VASVSNESRIPGRQDDWPGTLWIPGWVIETPVIIILE